MKKFLLTGLLAIAAGVFSFAQPKVGDVYEVDGIKTIVIHVSDDGKSGIVTSGIYNDSIDYLRPFAKSYYKRGGIDIDKKEWNANKKSAIPKRKEALKMFKKRKKMHELFSQFNKDGEHNFNIVAEFCEKNGLSMEKYFPEYAMVQEMGDDWYIPGYQEAEYYVNMLGFRLGRNNKFKVSQKMVNESITNQTSREISIPHLLSCIKISYVAWYNNHKNYVPFCILTTWHSKLGGAKYWYNVGTTDASVYYHSYLVPVRKVSFNE